VSRIAMHGVRGHQVRCDLPIRSRRGGSRGTSTAVLSVYPRMPLRIPLNWAVLADESRVGNVCATRGVVELGGTDKIVSSAP
jgi:hypothetical protein